MRAAENRIERTPRTVGDALASHGGVGPGFTALRLAAAAAVLVSHSFPLTGGPLAGEPLGRFSGGQTTLGGMAVLVFFVISGFLVTPSLIRARRIRDYAFRRIVRIFPALIVVVAAAALVLGPAVTTRGLAEYFNDRAFPAYFLNALLVGPTGLPGVFETLPFARAVNGSLWTLRFEAVCYCLLAILGARVLFGFPRMLLLAGGMLCVLAWWTNGPALADAGFLGLQASHLFRFLACFAAGVILYVWKDRILLDPRLALLAFCLAALALWLGFFHLLFPILGGYLVIYFGLQPALDIPFLHRRDYSYGFYLYAFPVQQSVVFLAPDYAVWWANILLSVPLTLLFAVVSWHAVEKPALSLKRRSKLPVGVPG